MNIDSFSAFVAEARKTGRPLWEVALIDQSADSGQSPAETLERMTRTLRVMREALSQYDPAARSESGLSGGAAARLRDAAAVGKSLSGPFLSDVMSRALMMAEMNACMGRIVAAPTAGSCGVLPSVILSAQERLRLPEEAAVHALLTAGGVGAIIASRATLSGAEGGCQAEVGSASAMAAAALVEMMGGAPEMSAHACAIALSNLMGLICDPVAGRVEVPCVTRNVIGAVGAVAAAELALGGIEYPVPADEVIDAMGWVGASLPPALRETGEGGLAVTLTGRSICERLAAPVRGKRRSERPLRQ
ncbi:MAG: L-serine ammonia-lyase, iron-sulfur-dependent, subunit alpha [Clostridiales bacterium]|nr:L-serine ammonia-lyase, iron-sulfur-dependent, subunit alpha [Clostridiales bacterium]